MKTECIFEKSDFENCKYQYERFIIEMYHGDFSERREHIKEIITKLYEELDEIEE